MKGAGSMGSRVYGVGDLGSDALDGAAHVEAELEANLLCGGPQPIDRLQHLLVQEYPAVSTRESHKRTYTASAGIRVSSCHVHENPQAQEEGQIGDIEVQFGARRGTDLGQEEERIGARPQRS
eukprot:1041753-Rhodomonas_salina.2